MRKALVVGVVFALGFTLRPAYAGECTAGMWSKILTNLQATMNDAGMLRCARAEVLEHSQTAYEGFANCNDAFRDGGLFNPLTNDYKDCSANVCGWLRANRWSHACSLNEP
jgi:hypothetical protein